MKKEHLLILKAVLINKTQEEEKEIDDLLSEKLCWAEIGGILINHRLGGYFYTHLTEQQRKKIPKEMRAVLKLLVKAQKNVHSEIIKEQNVVSEELDNAGIRYAMLKGAFLSSDVYEIGARRSNDLDIMVYEEDLDKLDILLRKLGYIQSNLPGGQMVEASKKEKIIQRMNYHDLVPYVKEISTGILELDINFLFDGKDNPIDKKVYDMDTKIYEGKNYNVRGLNPYTNLSHLCAHFYREATNTIWTAGRRDVTLYKIVDMINCIRYFEKDININEFIRITGELNMTKKTAFTFKILKEFYDISFVNDVLSKLDADNIITDDFMKKIYDHCNKTIVFRSESFYETAFSCVQ